MTRFLLHCLLALSLAFNGIVAPLAMEHMSASTHDREGAAGHGAPSADHGQQGAHAGHVRHVGDPGHDHASYLATTGDESLPPEQLDSSCCDGTSCQCGCALPPATGCFAMPTIAPVAAMAPEFSVKRVAITRVASSPFRPPAF